MWGIYYAPVSTAVSQALSTSFPANSGKGIGFFLNISCEARANDYPTQITNKLLE